MAINLEQMAMHLNVIFKKYAGKDGDCSSLNQNELCEMALKEFPHLCTSEKKDAILNGVIGKMDMDGDKKVTFEEFALFFAFISIALHG
ncbi:hypothetical protein XENTR_v10022827 [Xenopus tropicalis]|uniref:EF-hand domain-containing protein n=1 Tax=Xenopus tropicalis TaxID=8364 RepID=A0A1B8XWD6_XENTR|nr:hypothetical protein XENTR_v10022827 [Xenopus tropicalis]KAE8588941.1 hypothetical protein XENTR_v10022827 [Xenopus tropicalis]|eukprot:XP_002942724.1 PREDICTED: protein S100-G-like [Xenopus tropicalis]